MISRLPDVGTSIFTVMSKMAHEHGAINLSQGFPDFPIDDGLVVLVNRFMMSGHNQYAPMAGVAPLREIIADVVLRSYGRRTDPETEVTITSGGTEGIYASIAALVGSGDEVIMFDPSYDSYDPAIRLNGGVPVRLSLRPPSFAIDWDAVEKAIRPKTKLIIINTPHNPTGSVLSQEDLQHLQRIVLKHGLFVLSDEVYERIIYDNQVHQSVLRFDGLASQSIAVSSFGKTFHATGWKVGYTVAPPYLSAEIRKTHQFITFSVNTPIQLALAEYLKAPETYTSLGSFFQVKRDFFLRQLEGSLFTPLPCRGSYFQLVSYDQITDMPEMQWAEVLTTRFKVAAIPVSAFYKDKSDNRLLRFCFAKHDETLSRAGEILRSVRSV